jgi:hypothetical protein
LKKIIDFVLPYQIKVLSLHRVLEGTANEDEGKAEAIPRRNNLPTEKTNPHRKRIEVGSLTDWEQKRR